MPPTGRRRGRGRRRRSRVSAPGSRLRRPSYTAATPGWSAPGSPGPPGGVAARVGVFGMPTEREFVQVPLHVCEVEVADPVGLLTGRPALRVTAAGVDLAAARHRATLDAFAGYASLMLDPRRLATVDGRAPDPRADPEPVLAALRSGRSTGQAYAHGLADGDTYLVDATRAFPALHPGGSRYRPPSSVAAGYDWAGAVAQALLSHCRRLTVADAVRSTVPFPRIDLAARDLTEPAGRHRDLLAATGHTIVAYDITGPLRVPTVLCYLGSTPAGCASARSPADARSTALGQSLLRYQARANRQPDYAPPPVRALPGRLRGTALRPLPDAEVPDAGTEALLAQGYRPVVVALDHDPEVAAILPYTVHVLLI